MNPDPSDFSPSALFGDLLRLRMDYSVDDPGLLPDYLGSSWRGELGWQMQRLCCPFPRRGGHGVGMDQDSGRGFGDSSSDGTTK